MVKSKFDRTDSLGDMTVRRYIFQLVRPDGTYFNRFFLETTSWKLVDMISQKMIVRFH